MTKTEFLLRYHYNIKQTSDENKEKYQLEDYWLIQYQIPKTNITRTVWQTVRRITNEILGVKGLRAFLLCLWEGNWNKLYNYINPLSSTSDLDIISPYTIHTISSRQVMRIKKIINYVIVVWSNSKFSKLTSYELYSRH